MRKPLRFTLLALIVLALVLAVLGGLAYRELSARGLFRDPVYDSERPALPAELPRPAVLVFHKTNGFIHVEAIPAANALFEQLARQHGWSIVLSENGAIHNPEDLQRFDLVVWNNVTGDVLDAGQKQVFQHWLEGGGRWLGLHGSGGDRFSWTWFVEEVIGARFIGHTLAPQFTTALLRFEQPEHPALAGLPARMDWTDELYSFAESPRPKVNVLANLDEASYLDQQALVLNLRMGEDHPIVWWRPVGQGIAFYSALAAVAANRRRRLKPRQRRSSPPTSSATTASNCARCVYSREPHNKRVWVMDAAFIESYYATYNREDPQALRAFYAEDVVLASAMGELRGADAILDTYRFLTSQCHDRMTPLAIAIDGSRATVTIRDVFTAKRDLDDFMGRPLKQGETMELNLRGTYTVAEGKFTRIVIENL